MVDLRDISNLGEVSDRLDDLEPILKGIGALLVEASDRSFVDQRLGDFLWAERYPKQDEPFINIAGALSDLNRGRPIKGRRFDRRPALIDTGALRQSLTFALTGPTSVEAGSNLEYAPTHQHGLDSVQQVTATARDLYAQEIKQTKDKRRLRALAKLSFIFTDSELLTHVGPRPFVGLTDEVQQNIPQAISMYLDTGEVPV